MILKQVPSSETVIAQALPAVGVSVGLVAKTETATTTPGTFHDSVISTVTGVGAWNEAQLFPAVPLASAATYESIRPSIATVDSAGYVTRVSDGIAKIRCSMNGCATVAKVDVTATGGQNVSEFVEYTAGTISELLASALMELMTPGKTLPFFSSYNVAASTFTPSASCWAKDLSPSMAVATDISGTWSTSNRGAPITTRHHAGANHWGVSFPTAGNGYVIGTKIRYRGVSGTIYERTVIGVARWGDLVVATLNTALPADVEPLPVVGDWFLRSRTNSGGTARYYTGGVGFFLDQQFNAKAFLLGPPLDLNSSGNESATVNGDSYSNAIPILSGTGTQNATDFVGSKSAFFGGGATNDSGSAVRVMVNGSPALLFTLYGPVSGTPIFNNGGALANSLIAASDANAGISTGHTVTVAPDPTL